MRTVGRPAWPRDASESIDAFRKLSGNWPSTNPFSNFQRNLQSSSLRCSLALSPTCVGIIPGVLATCNHGLLGRRSRTGQSENPALRRRTRQYPTSPAILPNIAIASQLRMPQWCRNESHSVSCRRLVSPDRNLHRNTRLPCVTEATRLIGSRLELCREVLRYHLVLPQIEGTSTAPALHHRIVARKTCGQSWVSPVLRRLRNRWAVGWSALVAVANAATPQRDQTVTKY